MRIGPPWAWKSMFHDIILMLDTGGGLVMTLGRFLPAIVREEIGLLLDGIGC